MLFTQIPGEDPGRIVLPGIIIQRNWQSFLCGSWQLNKKQKYGSRKMLPDRFKIAKMKKIITATFLIHLVMNVFTGNAQTKQARPEVNYELGGGAGHYDY